jgi:hypothetical protein
VDILPYARRRGLTLPDRLPTPDAPGWRPGYARVARDAPGLVERDLDDALVTVRRLVDPILGGTPPADGTRMASPGATTPDRRMRHFRQESGMRYQVSSSSFLSTNSAFSGPAAPSFVPSIARASGCMALGLGLPVGLRPGRDPRSPAAEEVVAADHRAPLRRLRQHRSLHGGLDLANAAERFDTNLFTDRGWEHVPSQVAAPPAPVSGPSGMR